MIRNESADRRENPPVCAAVISFYFPKQQRGSGGIRTAEETSSNVRTMPEPAIGGGEDIISSGCFLCRKYLQGYRYRDLNSRPGMFFSQPHRGFIRAGIPASRDCLEK